MSNQRPISFPFLKPSIISFIKLSTFFLPWIIPRFSIIPLSATNFVLLRTNETKEAGIGEKNSGPQGTCVVNSYSSQKRSLCQTISQNGSDKSSQCLPTASPEVDDNANGIHRRPVRVCFRDKGAHSSDTKDGVT